MLDELCKGLGELALDAGFNGFCENRDLIVVVENYGVFGAATGGVR